MLLSTLDFMPHSLESYVHRCLSWTLRKYFIQFDDLNFLLHVFTYFEICIILFCLNSYDLCLTCHIKESRCSSCKWLHCLFVFCFCFLFGDIMPTKPTPEITIKRKKHAHTEGRRNPSSVIHRHVRKRKPTTNQGQPPNHQVALERRKAPLSTMSCSSSIPRAYFVFYKAHS